MIVFDGSWRWVNVDQPHGEDIEDPLLFSIISNLVDQVNDLGEELVELKSEVEDGRSVKKQD